MTAVAVPYRTYRLITRRPKIAPRFLSIPGGFVHTPCSAEIKKAPQNGAFFISVAERVGLLAAGDGRSSSASLRTDAYALLLSVELVPRDRGCSAVSHVPTHHASSKNRSAIFVDPGWVRPHTLLR